MCTRISEIGNEKRDEHSKQGERSSLQIAKEPAIVHFPFLFSFSLTGSLPVRNLSVLSPTSESCSRSSDFSRRSFQFMDAFGYERFLFSFIHVYM